MRIAIDFDDTLTSDPELWLGFIDMCSLKGHKVVCVTARRDSDENLEAIDSWMIKHDIEIPVYFTRLESKVEYMKRVGLDVDIWIDDDPKRCALGF